MSKQGLALQTFSSELINCLDSLKEKRKELQAVIDLEELEKAKLQSEIECLSNRLSALMVSLSKKIIARSDMDRALSESETALCRLLENSQMVVNNIRREVSTLTADDIMKTTAGCPAGPAKVCLIEPNSGTTNSCSGATQQEAAEVPPPRPPVVVVISNRNNGLQ